MSILINEYASNNSINENKYNSEKIRASKMHKIKQLLKPVFAMLRKKSLKSATYKKAIDVIPPSVAVMDYDSAYESDQNDINERLEQRIIEEIDCCDENAAITVYHHNNEQHKSHLLPVHRGQHYIPVHFAKTAAGTFFWTTMSTADSDICCYGDQYAISGRQSPEEQVPCDRWAQA